MVTASPRVSYYLCSRRIAKLKGLGWLALATTIGAMVAGHVMGSAGRLAVALASVQAMASGGAIFAALPRRRWMGLAVALILLTGIALGATVSSQMALGADAFLAHAMIYAALLVVFGRSLRPGQVAFVTRIAAASNPRFRPAMVPYTRAVTITWCVFAAAQLVGSATLLASGFYNTWLLFVTALHPLMAIVLAVAEYASRCWMFPGEHTSFGDTVRAVRAHGRANRDISA